MNKTVYCEDVPDEAAVRANPWDYAVEESDTDQVDWEVLSVEEVEP